MPCAGARHQGEPDVTLPSWSAAVNASRLGIKHQGHVVKEDVRLGNLWATMFDRMQVRLPDNFQGGEADGIVEELLLDDNSS